MEKEKTAIIIGAGPAGLTAAYELVMRTNIKPIIFEATNDFGGIAKTINHNGNRMDIGGHRFFSKSQRVMDWWLNIFPLEVVAQESTDKVMLLRNRVSRIFFLRKFFAYPLSLNSTTFKNLGFLRVVKIGFSYLTACLLPLKNEKTLEDFFINRFGKELYATFFKDYTEKVWGISCDKIKPEWGAQRIKGLSITKACTHALKKLFAVQVKKNAIETSLIDQFIYPKYGPGQLWEEVAALICARGGEIHKNCEIIALEAQNEQVKSIDVRCGTEVKKIGGDYFISTMPIKDLIASLNNVPNEVATIANGLIYRDFMTVGLLLKQLKLANNTSLKDNWIYVQEKDVKLGRIQVFNNWSPYLVKDAEKTWLGLEYFCTAGDALWSLRDSEFIDFAIEELAKIDIIDQHDVLDSTLIRMPKAYPAYFGSYDNLSVVTNYLNQFENLFLIGRNGMHRYNNMDHSMLTAMVAVDNIIGNCKTKENIWQVNAECEYQESNEESEKRKVKSE